MRKLMSCGIAAWPSAAHPGAHSGIGGGSGAAAEGLPGRHGPGSSPQCAGFFLVPTGRNDYKADYKRRSGNGSERSFLLRLFRTVDPRGPKRYRAEGSCI